MAASWFIERQGKETGPYSSQQLKELAASGKLRRTDLVRRQDQGKAVPAERINGLFSSSDGKAQSVPPPVPVGSSVKANLPPRPAPNRASGGGPGAAPEPVVPDANPSRPSLLQRFTRLSLRAKVLTVIGLVAVGSFTFSCVAGVLMHMAGVTPKANQGERRASSAGNKAAIAHAGGTTIKMPKLPESRTHVLDKDPGDVRLYEGSPVWLQPPIKNSDGTLGGVTSEDSMRRTLCPGGQSVSVKDIESIDFTQGPNGEELHVELFPRSENGAPGRAERHYYLTQDGKKVYHGLSTHWRQSGGKVEEEGFVYGICKFRQASTVVLKKELSAIVEVYKGDEDHTRSEFAYYETGQTQSLESFRVRHEVGPAEDKQSFVRHGLRTVFWDTTAAERAHKMGVPGAGKNLFKIEREERYEDGRLVGRVVYDRQGKVLASEGQVGK